MPLRAGFPFRILLLIINRSATSASDDALCETQAKNQPQPEHQFALGSQDLFFVAPQIPGVLSDGLGRPSVPHLAPSRRPNRQVPPQVGKWAAAAPIQGFSGFLAWLGGATRWVFPNRVTLPSLESSVIGPVTHLNTTPWHDYARALNMLRNQLPGKDLCMQIVAAMNRHRQTTVNYQ